MSKKEEVCWIFKFALESVSGEPVDRRVASELLEYITAWAESRDFQIGGGYHKPRPEDLVPGPIFEVDDKQSES